MITDSVRSLLAVLEADLEASGTAQTLSRLPTVRGQATVLFRLSHLAGRRLPAAGLAIKQFNHFLTGADIAWQAQIGPGMQLYHPTGVVIGPWARIGSDCEIQQGVTVGGTGFGLHRGQEVPSPTIGDAVKIGAGARIVGGVTLGDQVLVGANAVVVKSVPSGTTAAGVPATVRQKRRPADPSPSAQESSDADV